jgi:DNA-binding MarR family transcriptional regulator
MKNDTSLENLFQLVHSIKRKIHRQIEGLDLELTPMQVRIIKIIHKKKPCTAIDIANALERDKAQITRLLTPLIQQNFIAKKINPTDKRSQYLTLTKSGQAVMTQLLILDDQLSNKMMTDLNSQELLTFQQTIEKMIQNITESSISLTSISKEK